jgi:hypothetical protein
VPCEWAGLDVIDYRHYVRELATKPQAVRQVAAELTRDLGPSFVDAWRALVDAHGPKQGARIFAKVLSYVETRGIDSVATNDINTVYYVGSDSDVHELMLFDISGYGFYPWSTEDITASATCTLAAN